MSDEVEASYSIGGDKLQLQLFGVLLASKDEKVLVLSEYSNTSRFILKELEHMGVAATVASTSDWMSQELRSLKNVHIVKVPRGSRWYSVFEKNSYDVIFDPFFDIYMEGALKLLDFYGKYISCGFKNQHETFAEKDDESMDIKKIMVEIMAKNLSIVGNCIGSFGNPKNFLRRYSRGEESFYVDSVFKYWGSDKFLDRRYNFPQRGGKFVLLLNETGR